MGYKWRRGYLARTYRSAVIVDYQFFIGLFAGSLLTFGYVVRTLKRIYHPIIRAQQAALMEYKNARAKPHHEAD